MCKRLITYYIMSTWKSCKIKVQVNLKPDAHISPLYRILSLKIMVPNLIQIKIINQNSLSNSWQAFKEQKAMTCEFSFCCAGSLWNNARLFRRLLFKIAFCKEDFSLGWRTFITYIFEVSKTIQDLCLCVTSKGID